MNTRNDVVDGIRSSLELKNRVALIEKYIADGCTITEIAEGFSGTKWRFYLKNCGLRIMITDLDALCVDLEQALAGLLSTAAKLVAHDMSQPPSHEVIAQTRVRTEVARAAIRVKSAEAQTNLFFMQKDKVKWESGDPISECLNPLGFEWKGGDIVSEIPTNATEGPQVNVVPGSPVFPYRSRKNAVVH